jgi:hypothetical protein
MVNALGVLEREGESRSYRYSILGCGFIVSLVVSEFVLKGVMPLNKRLQKENVDIVEAARDRQVLIETFSAEKADDALWELYSNAVTMVEAQDVEPKSRLFRLHHHENVQQKI